MAQREPHDVFERIREPAFCAADTVVTGQQVRMSRGNFRFVAASARSFRPISENPPDVGNSLQETRCEPYERTNCDFFQIACKNLRPIGTHSMSTLPRTRSTLLGRLRDIDNQDAWEEFVETYGPRVYDWCCRFNLQPADAADVTQNVLTRLCKAMQTFRYDKSRGSFRSCLKTVTANAARDFLHTLAKPDRATGDSDVVFGLDALRDPDAIEDLTSVLEAEAERELVREAEEQLPDPGRTIVVLRYYSGFNSKEISDILGVPDTTVRSHLRRGRLQMAAALEHLELSDESMS